MKFKPQQKFVEPFESFDLHSLKVWNKKKKVYVVNGVWVEDNFTSRSHLLDCGLLKLWRKKLSDLTNDSVLVLDVKPHVSFEIRPFEIAPLLKAVEHLIKMQPQNVGKD